MNKGWFSSRLSFFAFKFLSSINSCFLEQNQQVSAEVPPVLFKIFILFKFDPSTYGLKGFFYKYYFLCSPSSLLS